MTQIMWLSVEAPLPSFISLLPHSAGRPYMNVMIWTLMWKLKLWSYHGILHQHIKLGCKIWILITNMNSQHFAPSRCPPVERLFRAGPAQALTSWESLLNPGQRCIETFLNLNVCFSNWRVNTRVPQVRDESGALYVTKRHLRSTHPLFLFIFHSA